MYSHGHDLWPLYKLIYYNVVMLKTTNHYTSFDQLIKQQNVALNITSAKGKKDHVKRFIN